MTAPGKSLKEIFDAGTQKLLDLEQESNGRLNVTADGHGRDRKATDNAALIRVESRTGELETELRGFMGQSIERLQKVMESEIKETEEHLSIVKRELTNLAERLKVSIVELRKAYEENVDTLCMSLADGYEGVVESSTMELEKQDFASSRHLRAHGTTVMNSLQQKLDYSLLESRGEEKQYNTSLFKAFLQKANSIDTHFSTLMQKLSIDFQGHFKVVEGQLTQADPELNRVSHELAGEIDGYASSIETDIRHSFQTVLDDHSRKLDSSLSSVAQDLSSVHDATTERLQSQTGNLSDSFVSVSGDACNALRNKCTDLQEQIEIMLDRFNTRLEEKLLGTQTLRSTLQNEKDNIFHQVRRELEETRDGFETRLTHLMGDAIGRINNIDLEAEHEITDAHKRCDEQLKRDGLASRLEIEQSVAEFLQMLAEHRRNALDLIVRSAGGVATEQKQGMAALKTEQPPTAPPPSTPPPSRFDFTDDLDF